MAEWLSAFGALMNFKTLGLMCFGMVTGIIFGALPGLTALMGVALLMPMTFFLPVEVGLPMLLCIYVGGIYGGSISAVLIRTPGTPASVVTTLDGYPMAQKGEAGKALSLSLISSFVGGIISISVLTFAAPLLGGIALQFGPIEMTALILVGIMIIGYLSGNSVLKGWIAALLGLLLAAIGQDPLTGLPRLAFGATDLYGGITLMPAVIGLFAISEVFFMVQMVESKTEMQVVPSLQFVRFRELTRHTLGFIKGSVIGTFIGALPGAASGTAAWLSYGEAKRASKHPDKFGTGLPEGVIASETANNAVTGGALIPALALGIPGDPVTAVLIGGLLIQGLRPGPLFFLKSMDVAYEIFIAMFIANILMVIFAIPLIKLFGRILQIPKALLATLVMILCLVGSYALNNSLFDCLVAVLLGMLGFFLRKRGFPLAPMVLAFVLAPIFEKNLRRALIMTDGSLWPFFHSYIAVALFICSALLLLGLAKTGKKG